MIYGMAPVSMPVGKVNTRMTRNPRLSCICKVGNGLGGGGFAYTGLEKFDRSDPGAGGEACPRKSPPYLVMTPQAIRPPALPAGSLL